MHCLLPLITLLIPLALAFPKGPNPSRHHDDDDSETTTKTISRTHTRTTFPTLTIPASFTDIDSFPTGCGSGTVFSYPTAFSTGDFNDMKMRRRALLEGRHYEGAFGTGTGTGSFPTPTCDKHKGKHGGKDGDKDDDDKDDGGDKHDGKDD
jgi:hypothetical protein